MTGQCVELVLFHWTGKTGYPTLLPFLKSQVKFPAANKHLEVFVFSSLLYLNKRLIRTLLTGSSWTFTVTFYSLMAVCVRTRSHWRVFVSTVAVPTFLWADSVILAFLTWWHSAYLGGAWACRPITATQECVCVRVCVVLKSGPLGSTRLCKLPVQTLLNIPNTTLHVHAAERFSWSREPWFPLVPTRLVGFSRLIWWENTELIDGGAFAASAGFGNTGFRLFYRTVMRVCVCVCVFSVMITADEKENQRGWHQQWWIGLLQDEPFLNVPVWFDVFGFGFFFRK